MNRNKGAENKMIRQTIKELLSIVALVIGFVVLIPSLAKADILNPVTQAEVKNLFKDLAPIVYTLEACDSEYHIPAFKWVMDYGYLVAEATDSMDKSLVDMYWPSSWMLDDDTQDLIRVTEKYHDSMPEIQQGCTSVENMVKTKWMKQ